MPAWFDATTIDPAQGSSNLPLGRHPVVITRGAREPVKDKPNSGKLVFDVTIIDGQHKGTTGKYSLNLFNENPQSAEIAGKQLSAICHVVNQYHIESPIAAELFNKPFVIVVEQQPAPNDKYTTITGVLDMAGNPPTKGQATAAPQQPAYAPPAPTQQPAYQPPAAASGQPSWGAPQAQAASPSWNSPPTGGVPAPPQQPAAPAGPSWSQAPAGASGGQPSWARP